MEYADKKKIIADIKSIPTQELLFKYTGKRGLNKKARATKTNTHPVNFALEKPIAFKIAIPQTIHLRIV